MKFRSLNYYVREAVKSLVKNSLMSVASIITVASCIFIVIISFCIALNVDYVLKQFEHNIGVSVMLEDKMEAGQVTELYNLIAAMEHIGSVKYVSPDEALKRFAEGLGDDKVILEGLENDNPLPRSFEIEISDIRYQDEIVNKLLELKNMGVRTVNHGKDVADILIATNNILRIVCIIMILGLGVISIVIITNTIKIAVNSRKTEINIMKYVGATDWFIRWPFIIEGLLIGVIGGFLPVIVCWFSYGNVVEFVYERFPIIDKLVQFRSAVTIFPALTPVAVILGAVIGISGSVTSMRRHLKV